MKRTEFIEQITALVADLIPTIADDYRVDEESAVPGMLLTVGADADGWSYQTGDNSYTGGAYGYASWGLGYIYRDSDPLDVANSIADDLECNEPPDDFVPIFSDYSHQNRFQLQIGLDDARSCSQPGKDADEDVTELRRKPYIIEQLDKLDAATVAAELKEYGAWDDEQLADHDENLQRLLWLACGNVAEDNQ